MGVRMFFPGFFNGDLLLVFEVWLLQDNTREANMVKDWVGSGGSFSHARVLSWEEPSKYLQHIRRSMCLRRLEFRNRVLDKWRWSWQTLFLVVVLELRLISHVENARSGLNWFVPDNGDPLVIFCWRHILEIWPYSGWKPRIWPSGWRQCLCIVTFMYPSFWRTLFGIEVLTSLVVLFLLWVSNCIDGVFVFSSYFVFSAVCILNV
jgi:hypothetical protein